MKSQWDTTFEKIKKNEFQRNEIIQLGREKIDWERGGKLTQIKKQERERESKRGG